MSQERERSRDRSRRDRAGPRFGENSRDRSTDRGRDRGGSRSSINRVYVSNIPYEYRWQDMKDLFREQVGDVSFVEMFVDENDKPRGCGIVEFSDSASVKKCLEIMQRYEVRGRKLVIKEDSGNMRDKYGNIVGGGGGGGGGGGSGGIGGGGGIGGIGGNKRSRGINDDLRFRDERDSRNNLGNNSLRQDDNVKWGNTYGLSPHFLESLNIESPLCNRVFVANLDYSIDKKKLKDVFRLAGRIVRVDVPLDKDGRSRGFAVIEYDHPVEAVQAISMLHNQILFDRTMTVRMDRANNDTFKLPEGLKSIGMGLGQNGEPLRNVAYNLPSSGSNSSVGAGILGAVPTSALQVASALSGLNNVSAFGNLNPSVLSANLTGLASNLLQNGLANSNNDLSSFIATNASLLGGQNSQISALQSGGIGNAGAINISGPGGGGGGGGGSNSNQGGAFGRASDGYNPNTPVTYPTNYGSSGRGNSFSQNPYGGGNLSNMKSEGKTFTRKILISNLPPSASFKMIQDKLNEFGEITYWEEKGTGSFLVVYSTEWQAERAIKNLDKARIDGRYIEARTYY